MKRSTKYNDPEKDEPDLRHENERSKHYQFNPNFVPSKYSADSLEYPCETFTSLRLSNINPRVPDEDVREAVHQTFKKFGEFNIKFAHTVDRRLVYVNFAFNEDAIVARNVLSNRFELFDRLVCIETINHNRQWSKSSQYRDEYGHCRQNSPGHRVQNESWDYQRKDVRLPDYYCQPRMGEDSRQMMDTKHIPPEEDRRATRTLFVANVDDKMDPEVLRKYFDPYGSIEDIDVKCPTKGYGNPYAFVRYFNLDMAYAAKVELSGQMLGRYQCKIGYARPVPTTCVWVGGLTDAVHKHDIIANFEKFGKIVAFKWPRGLKYAYIAYDSVDAAQLAIIEMRGFPLPGTTRGLRTDFVELKQLEMVQSHDKDGKRRSKRNTSRSLSASSSGGKRSGAKRKHKVSKGPESIYSSSSDEDKSLQTSNKKRRDSSSKSDSNASNSSEGSLEKRKATFQIGNIEAAETIVDLARCLPVLWSGLIELKNSTFFTHMHLVSGNGGLVDSLIKGLMTPNQPSLKINQRLRLDKSRLKEVEKRITLSGNEGHCVLLAVSENSKDIKAHRPLTNLVSYLKQKNAAGVLSLSAKQKQNHDSGLLHTFPPCEFAYSYLQKCAPKLIASFDENDYIVAILVKVN